MDRIISILGLISIMMFVIGIWKFNYKKINAKKKFKTILTRTSSEELVNPTPPSITFNKLFTQPSIWIGDFGQATKNKKFYDKKKKFKTILTRTSSEELVNPTPPSITFNKLFTQPSVFIGDFGQATKNKKFYQKKK